MSTKPEKVFRVGAVRASIFQNTMSRNGQEFPLPKIVIEVRYRDKDGQWKGTNSLSLNEVPKAILALQQAFEFLTVRQDPRDEPSDMQAATRAMPRGPHTQTLK